MVNINGIPYEHREGMWSKITSNLTVNALHLIHSFNETIDNSNMYDGRDINPAYDRSEPDHANIMADIIAVMNERNSPGEVTIIKTKQEDDAVDNLLPFKEWIGYVALTGIIFLMITGCLYCGGGTLLTNAIPCLLLCYCARAGVRRRQYRPDVESRGETHELSSNYRETNRTTRGKIVGHNLLEEGGM